MTLYKAGSATITVTDGGSYNNGAGTTVTVNPAGASTLAIVLQPSSVFAGSTISPAISVQVDDAFGNSVSDNGLSVTLSPSANTIASGATASTNLSGLATFSSVTIDTAAVGLTLTASANGVTPSAASSSFNVTVLVNSGDTFTDTASDAGSGVKSVSYYYCAGLTGSCGASNGTLIGSPATTAPYTVAWNSQPADGSYQVVAVGTDNVSNVSGSSTSIPVTVDNTAPAVSISFPVNGSTYNSSTWANITGTASDVTSGIVSTAVAIENTNTSKWWGGTSFNQSSADYLAASGTTSWSYALAASNLTLGDSYSATAQATDGAGNVGSATASFTYEVTGSYNGSSSGNMSGSTRYYRIDTSSTSSSTSTNNAITPGVAETLKSFTFAISSTSNTTFTATVGLITSGSWGVTALTCSIPSGQTSCTVTANVPVSATQSLNVRGSGGSGTNARSGTWTTAYTQP
jgi:hypothetical protein